MPETSSLSISFAVLAESPPEGLVLSDRVLNPEILIDRKDDRITADLVGVRVIRGIRHLLRAPTKEHNWVIDGGTLRALPTDAPSAFLAALGNRNEEDLSYSEAISLLRTEEGPLPISASEKFNTSGRLSAAELPVSIEISGLNASLFPYQAQGNQWMWETRLQLHVRYYFIYEEWDMSFTAIFPPAGH